MVCDLWGRQREYLAERAGFEPAVTFATPLFESGTINHSDTSPSDSVPQWDKG